jgi:hypothetical protein
VAIVQREGPLRKTSYSGYQIRTESREYGQDKNKFGYQLPKETTSHTCNLLITNIIVNEGAGAFMCGILEWEVSGSFGAFEK